MTKSDVTEKGLMRISELSKVTGVSLPTIHYYVREGLLFPSLKTARNMAYYSQGCVDDIQLIKELQSKRFLPLSVIKLILHAKREGQNMDHIAEMESVLGDVFQPIVDEVEYKSISLSELVAASGLSESDIKALEAEGLIIPIEIEHGLTYDDIDIRIAQIFKKLAEFGLKLHNFDIYHRYMEIIRTEFMTIHDTIHRLPNHEIIPFQELFKIVGDLKRCLAMRVYREEAKHHHERDLLQREDS